MALTITEQMNLIKGTLKPPSNEMIDLVHQAAINYAYDFNLPNPAGYKIFAIANVTSPFATINADATNYVSKMLALCSRVFQKDLIIINALKTIIIGIIGKSSITYAQVVAANDAGWEATIAANIPRSFELLAGVTKQELINYTTPVVAS